MPPPRIEPEAFMRSGGMIPFAPTDPRDAYQILTELINGVNQAADDHFRSHLMAIGIVGKKADKC